MKYLVIFESFKDKSNYQQLSDIRDNCNEILFELSDSDIKCNLWGYEGVRHKDGDIRNIIRIEIGDQRKRIKINEFESEFNHLLSYLDGAGFVFSKKSFVENDSWDPYWICPGCGDDRHSDDRYSGDNTVSDSDWPGSGYGDPSITCSSCKSTFDLSDFQSNEHYIDKTDFTHMISNKYWVQFISLEFEKII